MLAWGILLLVSGAIGFFVSGPKMNEFTSGIGQITTALSSSAARDFHTWQNVYYGSIIAIAIGGVLSIIGGIRSRRSSR